MSQTIMNTYTEERGERHYKRSEADAIVNPKQMECTYPYKNLCGAAVAWKVIQILYEKCDIAVEESYDFFGKCGICDGRGCDGSDG